MDRTRGYVARDADGEAAQRTRRESLNPYAAPLGSSIFVSKSKDMLFEYLGTLNISVDSSYIVSKYLYYY